MEKFFDIQEARKSNILITGANAVGKTYWAFQIADFLRFQGWKVFVFDPTGVWKQKSNIPYYIEMPTDFIGVPEITEEHLETSLIFDFSLLIPQDTKARVEMILFQLWNLKLSMPNQWILLVFEEFQLFGRYLRGWDSQQILRVMSAGRNIGLRVLGITIDLALVDPVLVRLCGQRYHFKLLSEENAKRKFKSFYGKDWLRTVQNLEPRQCIYWKNGEFKTFKTPTFYQFTKPQNLTEPEKESFLAKLLKALLGG